MVQILDSYGRPLPAPRDRRRHARRDSWIRGRFDAAQTTTDNQRHWANADGLSATAAASPEIRQRLRERARYECHESNAFAKGIILTLAHDTIGTGPRLQMMTQDKAGNQQVERAFRRWARQINLGAKLRTARMAKAVDGEVFVMQTTNRRLRGPVQLDVRVIEADHISSPWMQPDTPDYADGIHYDAEGNPNRYDVLKAHPGDIYLGGDPWETDPVAADDIVHYFRQDRPGQRRGWPEVTPSLPLFAQLRRFTLATLDSAETAAELSGIMKTQGLADDDPDEIEAMEAISLERRALLTLPKGWDVYQMKAEHPSTTYQMFRDAILNEIARSTVMPFNVAAGNSAGYNYSSGRLDHQVYFKAIGIERHDVELLILDRIFLWWLEEAMLIPGLLPEGLPLFDELDYRWFWDEHEHVDPQKEANALIALWEAGHITDDEVSYRRGRDPEEHYAQLAAQLERRRALGLPLPGQTPANIERSREEQQAEEEEVRRAQAA